MVLFALVRGDGCQMGLAQIQDPEMVTDEDAELELAGLGISEPHEEYDMGMYGMGGGVYSHRRNDSRPPDIAISPSIRGRDAILSSPVSPVRISSPVRSSSRLRNVESVRDDEKEKVNIVPKGAMPEGNRSPESNASSSDSRRLSRLSQLSQLSGFSRITSQLAHLGGSYGVGQGFASPTSSQLSEGSGIESEELYEKEQEQGGGET